MKRISLILAVTAAALAAWPAVSSAGTYRGVVVGKQRGVLLVASQSGQVRDVATSSPAAVGSRVAVSGHSVRVVGRSRTARIRGVVVRRTKHTVFLSAGHRLLAVHSSRALMSASDQSPTPTTPTPTPTSPTPTSPTNLAPGTNVQGTVTITPTGDLEDEDMQSLGTTNATQVTATVTNVAAGAVTVTVNGQTLTIPLPAGLTLPSTLVGQTITLTLTFANGQTQAEPDDQSGDNNQGQSFSGSTGSGGSGDQSGGDQNGGSQNGGGENG